MARREYTLTTTDMPEERSIKALDVGAQWLYDRLRLRKEINRCGVLQWRPAVFTELAPDATERKIRSWTKQLEAGVQIVLDEPYAECLVRTYVRWDGLLGQPNVVPHLVYDFGLIASTKVRLGFLKEFRRLWDLDALSDGERGGWLLAVGHYPRQKHAKDDPAKWPIALEPNTLARLVKEIGTGLREPLTSAIAAGAVRPFTADDPHGIPEPLQTPHPGTPSPHPTEDGSSRAHVSAPARTEHRHRAPTPSTGVPNGTNTASVPPEPDQPAAAAASTHTRPVDPDELIQEHVGQVTGAVRLGLRQQITDLHHDGLEPITIAAALTAWAQRPGSGPGLLAYLANDLLLDTRLKTKPKHTVNGSAPDWCHNDTCDPHSRWREADDGRWYRCPTCHPLAARANNDYPQTPPTPAPASLMAGPDDPPF